MARECHEACPEWKHFTDASHPAQIFQASPQWPQKCIDIDIAYRHRYIATDADTDILGIDYIDLLTLFGPGARQRQELRCLRSEPQMQQELTSLCMWIMRPRRVA